MNKHHLLLFTMIALFCAPFSQAVAFEVVKDTYYFLKGDGEFTDEEKDEEAQYIFGLCQENVMQRAYFSCECIAGAFRVKRDTDEQIRPQSSILNELFDGEASMCVDKPKIAGLSYKFCADYAKISSSRASKNEEYCSCVGNRVASQFEKNPLLRTHHVERLRTNALTSCHAETY